MICMGKGAAIDDIKRHIVAVGSKGWVAVQARHPSVSPASFWRYVREAKGEMATEDMQVVCEHGVRSDIAELGADGVPRRIDFLSAYRRLFADVEALREYALNADGTIRSALLFDRAIMRRMTLLARSVKLTRQIYSVRHVQVFMDALLDEIASESPVLQQRMMTRLRRLQAAVDPGRRSCA